MFLNYAIMMRTIYSSLFSVLVYTLSYSQIKTITLESEGKIKRIPLEGKSNLRLLTSATCDGLKWAYQEFEGKGLEIKNNEIVIKPKSQFMRYRDSSRMEKRDIVYPETAMPITFHMEQVLKLDYQSNSMKHIRNSGYWLITLGVITSLVVAPLISLKSGSGFNASRYYSTAGIGLVAIGLSIPVFLFSTDKEYAFKDYDNEKRRIWKYVPEEKPVEK
jgi:hypothetical protein